MASFDDDLMSVIAQVADGSVTREEAVAVLRERKVDALDMLVEFLAMTGQEQRRRELASRVDVTSLRRPARAQRGGPPRQTPRLPCQLNGTLYDPQDVNRFDDTDLDFVAAGDRMLAFDDRDVLDGWLQNSVLTAQMSSDYTSSEAVTMKAQPSGGVTGTSGIDVDAAPPGGIGVGTGERHTGTTSRALLGPAGVYWVWDYIPHTNFYEDIGFGGDRLELGANMEFPDLTEVSMGLFRGSWNDQISSVQFVAMASALLSDDVDWQGSRLLLDYHQDTSDLRTFGWNDVASAVQTWGPLEVAGHLKVAVVETGP